MSHVKVESYFFKEQNSRNQLKTLTVDFDNMNYNSSFRVHSCISTLGEIIIAVISLCFASAFVPSLAATLVFACSATRYTAIAVDQYLI